MAYLAKKCQDIPLLPVIIEDQFHMFPATVGKHIENHLQQIPEKTVEQEQKKAAQKTEQLAIENEAMTTETIKNTQKLNAAKEASDKATDDTLVRRIPFAPRPLYQLESEGNVTYIRGDS